MSKAFTREDNEIEEELPETGKGLPKEGVNYMTPKGAEKLRAEMNQLLNVERPKIVDAVHMAALNGDRSENGDYIYGKKRLREIDRRLRFLSKRLDNAEIIDPTTRKSDQVFFGATVTVLTEDDEKKVYYVVGVDETNAKKGKISWISPIGKALIKARKGDRVSFLSPKGEVSLEILKIEYEPIPE